MNLTKRIALTFVSSLILVCSSLFFFDNSNKKKKITDIIKLVEVLEWACKQYFFDIGDYAFEIFSPYSRQYYTHNLTMNPAGLGYQDHISLSWNGPYISRRFLQKIYLYKGEIRVENKIKSVDGFDLSGDNIFEVRGHGNYVTFSNVKLETATGVNASLDSHLSDDNWLETGRVKYNQKTRVLSVYLVNNLNLSG